MLPLAFGTGGDGTNPPSPANPPVPPTVLGPQSFGDPSAIGMDEDYDACDLENWFLALQSADGSVMIPSFHRPGILTAADWTNAYTGTGSAADAGAIMSMAKILRPRSVDNYQASFPADPTPDPVSGQITYDVDNDGDGITDSVWLDLGYQTIQGPSGQKFKPLFAFMVLGLNGRLPLNTAGNLQSRDFQRPQAGPGSGTAWAEYYPQNFTDGATWSHASHLGYSVNEINPMYALQNAPNLVYGGASAGSASNFMQFDSSGFDPTNNPSGIGDFLSSNSVPLGNSYNRILGNAVLLPGGGTGQNAGVGVDIIQHRNLLAGTVAPSTTALTNDANSVTVAGTNVLLPNSMMDSRDAITTVNGMTAVFRSGGIMAPGRWGEANAVPTVLDIPLFTSPGAASPGKITNTSQVTSLYPIYTNAIRAGKSAAFLTNGVFTTGGDGMDDDGDSNDFFPFTAPTTPAPTRSARSRPYSSCDGHPLPARHGAARATPTTWPARSRCRSSGSGGSSRRSTPRATAGSSPGATARRSTGMTTATATTSGAAPCSSGTSGPPGCPRLWPTTRRTPTPSGPAAAGHDRIHAGGRTGSEFSTQLVDARPYNQPITGGPVLNTTQPTSAPRRTRRCRSGTRRPTRGPGRSTTSRRTCTTAGSRWRRP